MGLLQIVWMIFHGLAAEDRLAQGFGELSEVDPELTMKHFAEILIAAGAILLAGGTGYALAKSPAWSP